MKNIFIFLCLILINYKLYANEVKILDEELGNGVEVVNHSKLTVHYVGRLENEI